MINTSYGAPAFAAQLVPVWNLNAIFVFKIVKSFTKLVQDNRGHVFAIMSYDISKSENVWVFSPKLWNIANLFNCISGKEIKFSGALYIIWSDPLI